MGAPAVIEAAGMLPDQVLGVVLVDNIQEIEMQIPPPMAHFMDSMMMDLVMNPTKEKLVGGGFFKHNIDESTERVLDFLEDATHFGWQESLQGYIDWTNQNCIQSVQNVKAPIIAINSDMQPTNVEAFRKYAPTFKAKIVKDVGHVIMWDNPEEFNRLLEESIQEFKND
jgi:pimeloyl-ACP methyl ester carboxylesterase